MYIKLCGKKGEGLSALIDREDYEKVSKFKWYLNSGYAVSRKHRPGFGRREAGNSIHTKMHRLIKGITDPSIHVDHINRDRLDNRKGNLRVATKAQNAQNRKPKNPDKYVGVHKDHNKWVAKLGDNKVLGSFNTERQAALAYDKAARFFYGENARLNIPDEYYNKPVPHVDFEYIKPVPLSKYIGVSYKKGGKKGNKNWRAIYRRKGLGNYYTELEAHAAYQEAKHASQSNKKD